MVPPAFPILRAQPPGDAHRTTVPPLLTGCASIPGTGAPSITLRSDPAEATVYINGVERGTTPYTMDYDATDDGDELTIEMRKNGYQSSSISMRPAVNKGILFADAMP